MIKSFKVGGRKDTRISNKDWYMISYTSTSTTYTSTSTYMCMCYNIITGNKLLVATSYTNDNIYIYIYIYIYLQYISDIKISDICIIN